MSAPESTPDTSHLKVVISLDLLETLTHLSSYAIPRIATTSYRDITPYERTFLSEESYKLLQELHRTFPKEDIRDNRDTRKELT